MTPSTVSVPVLMKFVGLMLRFVALVRVPPLLTEACGSCGGVGSGDAASEGAAAAMVTTGADQAAPLTMVRRLGVCGVMRGFPPVGGRPGEGETLHCAPVIGRDR